MNKGESTRQRIIEIAAPLFNQRGFEGCSMQDLVDATGLEKGGLYRHFPSKEELASEAFKYALTQVIEARMGDLQRIEGSLEKLRYIVKRFVELPSPVVGGCPLMNTAIDADDGNAVLRGLAAKGLCSWKMRLCGILDEGIQRGEIAADVSSQRVANTIIATLEGSLLICRIEGTQEALHDAQEALGRVIDSLAAKGCAC